MKVQTNIKAGAKKGDPPDPPIVIVIKEVLIGS